MDPIRTTVADVTPADLVSLDRVKLALGITATDDDARLSALITEASATVTTALGRPFVSFSVIDTFSATSASRPLPIGAPLILSNAPVIAVSSVLEAGEALSSDAWLIADGGTIHRRSGDALVSWSRFPVVIAYTAGDATVPADVEAAVIGLVRSARPSSPKTAPT